MSQQHDPTELLRAAASSSEPPASLRARTLARAAEAWAPPAVPDFWRQIWESRPLRLAWATATVALVVANLALPSRASLQARFAQPSEAAQAEARRELREIVWLPRLRMEYAVADTAVRPRLLPESKPRLDHQIDKENRS